MLRRVTLEDGTTVDRYFYSEPPLGDDDKPHIDVRQDPPRVIIRTRLPHQAVLEVTCQDPHRIAELMVLFAEAAIDDYRSYIIPRD